MYYQLLTWTLNITCYQITSNIKHMPVGNDIHCTYSRNMILIEKSLFSETLKEFLYWKLNHLFQMLIYQYHLRTIQLSKLTLIFYCCINKININKNLINWHGQVNELFIYCTNMLGIRERSSTGCILVYVINCRRCRCSSAKVTGRMRRIW